MNCLNSEKYLREAMDSVFAQTYANWEIIFWDNASTDRSADIARSYGDDRVRYFRGETTVPLGHARNLAIAESAGEFIAFLDCDDIWLPTKLEKQVPLFVADDAVGLVYSDTVFFNADGTERRLYAKKQPYRGYCFAELLSNYLISLETAVIRAQALASLDHGFDTRFNAIEEYDLFVRLGLDWKIDFVPEVLAKWRVHDESWTWREPDRFASEKKVMLEKLERIEKVSGRHAGALAAAWHAQAIAEAKGLWQQGDARAARRVLGRSRVRTLKSAVFWLVSFLPFGAVQSAWHTVSRAVVPSPR